MADVVFREKREGKEFSVGSEEKLPEGKNTGVVRSPVEVEVPFTSYRQEKGKPLLVDYFKLGEYWDDPDGGFEEEINTIEEYLRSKIEKGEIADTITAVEKELKKMEKINNLKDEERIVVKLGTLAAYAKFLREAKNIRNCQAN